MSRKKINKPESPFKVRVENDGIYITALKQDNAQLTQLNYDLMKRYKVKIVSTTIEAITALVEWDCLSSSASLMRSQLYFSSILALFLICSLRALVLFIPIFHLMIRTIKYNI